MTREERDEKMREAVEADGYPVCPGCLHLMDRTHPGTPLREGGWTARTCACGRSWRVYVRDEGQARRVVGYAQMNDEPGPRAGEGTEAMKKNQTPNASSKKQADQKPEEQKKQAKAPRKAAATPNEPPVELLIDAEGIHSLTAGANPAEKTPTKAREPKAPAATETPDQPDDSGELVVFAFRLTRAERDLIHSAAGSARASKFVRELAVAAARKDGDALQRVIDGLQPASR